MEGYFVLLGKFVKHMCADRWLLMKIILFLVLTIMWLNLYIYIYIVVPSVELILIIWSMYLLKMLIKILVCDSAQCSCAYSTVRI